MFIEVCNTSGVSAGNMTQAEIAEYFESKQFMFWTFGVVGLIISVLGILGNVLAIVVLVQPRMRSSTAVYLIAQAVFDILVLMAMCLFLSLPVVNATYSEFFQLIQPYVYPVALISQTCSMYTTVAFTAERYVAVCYPLRAARWCTTQKARRALLLLVLGSVLVNVPRMFEYKVCYHEPSPSYNYSRFQFVKTDFGADPIYRHVYLICVHISVMLLIPFATLTFMNTMLIRAVRKSHNSQGKVVNAKQHKENNLTIMLIAVIAVFLICQLPSIPDNIFGATLDSVTTNTLPFVKLYGIATLMVITNSAANFYLYCVFGHKFRRVFCQLCCWRWRCCMVVGGFGDADTSVMLRGSSVGRGPSDHRHNGDSEKSVSPRPSYRYSKAPMGMRVSLGGGGGRKEKPSHNSSCQYTSIHNSVDNRASETNV